MVVIDKAGPAGNKPAGSVVRSYRISGRPKRDREIPIGFAEEVDAREKMEPVLERKYYPFEKALSEAVGQDVLRRKWMLNWRMPGWVVSGKAFTVARYYPDAQVVFDFADTQADADGAPARRAVLNSLGIVHIFFPMDAEMDVDAMKLEITRQRERINSNDI